MSNDKKKSTYSLPGNTFGSIAIGLEIYAAIRNSHFMREMIEERQKSFEAEVSQRFERIDKGDPLFSERMDAIHEDLAHLKLVLPEIQWKSHFVYSISLLEFSLNKLCEEARANFNMEIRYSDFSGSSFEKCKLYLSRLFGVSAFSGEKWCLLSDLGKLRNIIVHGNGEIKKDSLRLVKRIQVKVEGMSVLNHNDEEVDLDKSDEMSVLRVVLTAGFVIRTLESIGSFLSDLRNLRIPEDSIALKAFLASNPISE